MGVVSRVKSVFSRNKSSSSSSSSSRGLQNVPTSLGGTQSTPEETFGTAKSYSSGGSSSSSYNPDSSSVPTSLGGTQSTPEEKFDIAKTIQPSSAPKQPDRTITGQIGSSPKPSGAIVSTAQDFSKMSYQEPTAKMFFMGLGGRAKSVARGEQGVGFIFDPLRGVGKPKAFKEVSEQDIYFETMGRPVESGLRGTRTDMPLFDPRGMTYGGLQTFKEVQAGVDTTLAGLPTEVKYFKLGERIQKETESEIIAKYQPLVNQGLDIETAQTMAEEEFKEIFTKRYEERSGVLTTQLGRSKVSYLSQTQGDVIAGTGTFAIETGLVVGAFASGSPALVTGASGLLSGLGLKNIQVGATASDLTFKERSLMIGGGTLQAGLGAFGVSSAIAPRPTSLLARQSQRELLKDLELSKASIGGKELYRGAEGSMFKISTSKIIEGGRAIQDVDIIAPMFYDAQGLPRVVGGRAISRTTIMDVISDTPVTLKETFSIGGKITKSGTLSSFGKNKLNINLGGMGEDLGLQAGAGRGFIMRKGSTTFREFPISGISKQQDDVLKIIDVKPQKAVFQRNSGVVEDMPTLFGKKDVYLRDVFGIKSIKGRVSGTGEIQLLPTMNEDVIKVYRSGSRKTPFSKTFGGDVVQTQISSQSFGGEILPSITKETLKESSSGMKNLLKTRTRTIYSSKDSLGLKQESKQTDVLSYSLGSSLLPRQTSRSMTALFPRADVFNKGAIKQRDAILTAQIQPSAFKQKQIQKSIFGFGMITPPARIGGFDPGFRGRFYIPPFPSLNLGMGRGRRSSLLGSFKPSYTPSLTSRTFRLFGKPSKSALKTGVVTPFERRYLIEGKRKPRRSVKRVSAPQRKRRRKRDKEK